MVVDTIMVVVDVVYHPHHNQIGIESNRKKIREKRGKTTIPTATAATRTIILYVRHSDKLNKREDSI